MNKNLMSFLIVANVFALGFTFKFPADIDRCPIGDTECIRRVSNQVLEINGKLGHSGINLLPIDPLHIPNIEIKQGAESPVNIELKFKDVDLIGLTEHRFAKITGFQQNPAGRYLVSLKGPVLYLVGPYTISGRVLVLPIQGVGASNITLVNPDISISYDGVSTRRNGKEYLGLKNFKLTFTVTRIIFDFKNLYNGDKALGDSTNAFLNENWQDIFQEIRPNIFNAFALIAEGTVRNVFNKVPYADLFSN